MSGMTDNNEFDSIADGMRNDVSEIREMLIHNHDLTAEIRRLREENEKIRERCDHWSNRAIEINEEKGRLEKQLSGIGAEQYYTMRENYWDEKRKVDVLAKALHEIVSMKEEPLIEPEVRMAELASEVLRKYGLEGG